MAPPLGSANCPWLEKLVESGKYADLHIRCENIIFKSHHAIVCSHSAVLANLVDKLSPDNIIMHLNLTIEGIPVVQELLYWVYTSSYSDREDIYCLAGPLKMKARHSEAKYNNPRRPHMATVGSNKPSHESCRRALTPWSLIFNVQMFIAAIKYQLPDLKALAKENYEVASTYYWDSKEFLKSAELLWEHTKDMEEELKNAIAKVGFDHLEDLKKYDEFRRLLPGDGSFGRDMMEVVSKMAKQRKSEIRKEMEEQDVKGKKGFMEELFNYKV